jgi:ABC-type phosphate transport system substrate-binding protein
MRHIGAASCLLVFMILALVVVPVRAYSASIDWQDSQCWQTGQLGSESSACENAAAPNFLATHMVDNYKLEDTSGAEEYKLPTSGQYCSYRGISETLDQPEGDAAFANVPSPASDYQEGNGDGNICASWASSGELNEWGLQIDNSEAKPCADIDPRLRCGMERYISLDGQELNDRPWASYFGDPQLRIYNAIEPLLFQPKSGGGWGYLCPVLEDRKTGDILELCLEEWRSFAGSEWQYQHVAECKAANADFEHNIDKIVLPLGNTEEFLNGFGEPIESLSGASGFETTVGVARLEELVKLDNGPYREKEKSESDPAQRLDEPELGYGCGRDSSTTASEWALIGVSNGIEEWGGAEEAQTKLFGSVVSTVFEPLPIEISPETPAKLTEHEATLTGTLNPYGFPTKYVVEYGLDELEEHSTAETTVESTGTKAVPITATLTGLSPGQFYHYIIKAYHYEAGTERLTDITYGPEGIFGTNVPSCGGSNITGQGASLQKIAQEYWTKDFNTSSAKTACSGSQGSKGVPKVTYDSTSSGVGLASWGAEGRLEGTPAGFREGNAFIGTDEPPNEAQIANIEAQESTPTVDTLLTIPVAQESIAIVVDLPSGCTANSTPAAGRLALTDASLEGIFAGTTKTWGKLVEENPGDTITGTGCTEEPIRPVVREDQSGTTHILKRFLGLIATASLATADGDKSWNQLSEGELNTVWPTAADAKTSTGMGGGEEAHTVLTTPGSIGYVNLAEARAQGFAPATATTFWVELQRDKAKILSYADPSTNGDDAPTADANCKKTEYLVGNGTSQSFPPGGSTQPWNEVTAALESKTYPLCGLSYDLAFTNYSLLPGNSTDAAEMTVSNYLKFVVNKTGGQAVLNEDHDYVALPADVELQAAAAGALEIGF